MLWVEGDLLVYGKLLKRAEFDGKCLVFDPIRKKFVAATPEELVRQLVVQHLLALGYAPGRLRIERLLVVAGQKRRIDLMALDKMGKPMLLVECKRPTVALDQSVMHQAGVYLSACDVKYAILTNGRQTICFTRDAQRLLPQAHWPQPNNG